MYEAVTFFKKIPDFSFEDINQEISTKARDGLIVAGTYQDDNVFIVYFKEIEI